jgi:hypothetical protein
VGQQAGGNARFKGPGSLWKSSWKGKPMLSQLCCLGGFDPNFYENANGPLDIDLTDGFFAGALVGVSALPTGPSLIARNGAVANEGWDLYVVDATTDPEDPSVGFIFTVYGGAGPVAQISVGPLPLGGSWGSLVQTVFFPVVMYFSIPDGLNFPNGRIGLGLTNFPGGSPEARGEATLSAPYVNSDPHLYFGGDGADFLEGGQCLVGLTGGIDPAADFLTDPANLAAFAAADWTDALKEAEAFVAIPETRPASPTNTNGWGVSETAPGAGADPLVDFIGSEDLALNQEADAPTIACTSPTVYWSDNLAFPYA